MGSEKEAGGGPAKPSGIRYITDLGGHVDPTRGVCSCGVPWDTFEEELDQLEKEQEPARETSEPD